MIFPDLEESSRVWIYASNRELSEAEAELIRTQCVRFISEWAAHGNQLFGAADVFHGRFLVLAVDESKVHASGCSIDTSVRFIKELEGRFSIELLNRMYLWVMDNGEFHRVHFSGLGKFQDAMLFDPQVNTLGELRKNWLIPVKDTAFIQSA